MHSLGHWRLEPGLHDLAFLPNIVEPASRLLVQGQQVRLIAIIIIVIIVMKIVIIVMKIVIIVMKIVIIVMKIVIGILKQDDLSFDEVSVRLWHDQLFVKPPKTGSVVAWHQVSFVFMVL